MSNWRGFVERVYKDIRYPMRVMVYDKKENVVYSGRKLLGGEWKHDQTDVE